MLSNLSWSLNYHSLKVSFALNHHSLWTILLLDVQTCDDNKINIHTTWDQSYLHEDLQRTSKNTHTRINLHVCGQQPRVPQGNFIIHANICLEARWLEYKFYNGNLGSYNSDDIRIVAIIAKDRSKSSDVMYGVNVSFSFSFQGHANVHVADRKPEAVTRGTK